jgi:uncharacterized protein YodC (DUF2158 family)
MAGDKFQPGDQVQLKSGGPIMTVVEYAEYMDGFGYMCQWFDAKNELKSSVFKEAVLRTV